MTDTIRHRGPDDEGQFIEGPVGLGFRRLSILDLSPAGHQPMCAANGRVTIVFNGEIYNFVELRKELEALGHTFRSSGDTEVLLHAYLQWGRDCVRRLNGMWAFVIHDGREGRLFGSRDRFGIKPLFRHAGRRSVLFASEIKAIRASGEYAPAIDWRVASDFLLRGSLDRTVESFYDGIVQVGAGCAFELELDGRYREWSYWSLKDIPPKESADPAAEYAALFEDSVRLHMRSDVPVGVHLSGGLDSTSIICASARIRQAAGAADPLLAFCFTAREYDESRYIEATVAQTGATLVRLETDAQKLWDDLPRMLWFQDEPVHTLTAVVSYQLMALTAGHGLKVVLNGQGSDETAAGYPSYFVNYWHSLLRRGRLRDAWSEIGAHSRHHERSHGAVFGQQLAFLLRTVLASSAAYRGLSRTKDSARLRASPWFDPGLADRLPPPDEAATDHRLRAVLERAVAEEPLPLYLRIEDRNASAHSVESRVPFLDYRLVEHLFGIADDWHMRGPYNKFIQREAMRDRIPEVARTRLDKMGFPVPSRQLFAGPLYEPIRDLLGSREARERGVFKADAVLADLDRLKRGDGGPSNRVFDLAEFELWCRRGLAREVCTL